MKNKGMRFKKIGYMPHKNNKRSMACHAAFIHIWLFSLGSANRASAFACAALNALFGIDDVTIITLGNCANGALCFARAAGDASVGDYICHFYLPPV